MMSSRPQLAADPTAPASPVKIVVADNHSVEREYLRAILGRAGHEVLEASDGEQALDLIRVHRPDLVITDILMPTLDGLELVRRMRSESAIAGTRAIIWSAAFSPEETLTLAAALGAARFVRKPIQPDVLLAVIDDVLREGAAPPVPATILARLEEAHARLMSDTLYKKTVALEEEIASRRQIEAVLRESEQRFSGMLDSAMDAILSIDEGQRIVLFNRAAEAMFRCSAAEALGSPVERFIPERFRTAHRQHVEDFANSGATSRAMGRLGFLWALRADGEEFPIEASIAKVAVGGRWQFTVILRDETERQRLEDALRRMNLELEKRVQERTDELTRANEALLKSNQELQAFAFFASHDLQTPLRSIAGFAQLLQKEYCDRLDEQANHLIQRVVDNTLRLHRLIHDLLVYSRVESRATPFEPVDFRQVFDDVAATLSSSIRDAGAEVTHGELPTVLGDRSQLTQLLQNLIDNGIKYHDGKPPRIEVSARHQGQEWIFSVRDNGIGIAAKHQQRIFEIFRRLHTRRAYPGTGIGLAVGRRIVQRHGGRIWVESEPGHGSTFFFTLPDRGTT